MGYSKEEKAMWLEDWKQSGKNAWAYARENGLIPQTFAGWTKKEKKTKASFVEIPSKSIIPKLNCAELLIEKGDMRIHIPLEPILNELPIIIARLGQVL